MKYVDGFVLAVPTKNLAAYKKMATVGKKIWLKHGALQYVEAVADDLDVKFGLSYKKLVKPKRGETIIFAWIVYKSRAHRDQVNAKVMSDPQIKKSMENTPMPFDVKRMAYGGFRFLVEG